MPAEYKFVRENEFVLRTRELSTATVGAGRSYYDDASPPRVPTFGAPLCMHEFLPIRRIETKISTFISASSGMTSLSRPAVNDGFVLGRSVSERQ